MRGEQIDAQLDLLASRVAPAEALEVAPPRPVVDEASWPYILALGVVVVAEAALSWRQLSSSEPARSALSLAPKVLGIALGLGLVAGYVALSVQSAVTVARRVDHSARHARLVREQARVALSQQELRGALSLAGASPDVGGLEVAGQGGQIEQVRASAASDTKIV